jgi:hypothetical protein
VGSVDFEIRNRAELVDALSVAAQVEHVVLLEYLYAAFSCRHTQDASVPPAVRLTSWELARELYAIAHDEMDHLGAVQQLLAALGAPPVPDAWSFPATDPRLPFPCELTRLDLDAVDRFIRTESPEVPMREVALPTPPDPIRFDVLGDLYRAIVAGLRRLGDAVFLGAEVVGKEPSRLAFRPSRYPVATAEDAIRTIETVIQEGEGSSGVDPQGHWQRFSAMFATLQALGPDAELVSWPCVRNPVLRDPGDDATATTRLTDPVTVAVADIANRAYRLLWLLLGGTYVHDWSVSDPQQAIDRRRAQRGRSMSAARWVMATMVRPLGEILARLPAFAGRPDGPTAGMCFEQYGEFRVPAQPDARMTAALDELAAIAADLDTVAAEPALVAPWAGPRLAALALDARIIRERLRGTVPSPPRDRFEPPVAGPWLSVDFSGWYQARLATGGDPYNDPRGVSGWQFAHPGEPDLDRVLRWRPDGAFLREHLDPNIRIGVRVTSAALDDLPLPGFTGATVELLGAPVFAGHNGVMAADGDEPIVPLRLRVCANGLTLERDAADEYLPPYQDVASLGVLGGLPAARALRAAHGLPEVVFDADGRPSPAMQARLTAARARLQAAIDAATDAAIDAATDATTDATTDAGGDPVAVRVLRHRLATVDRMLWPYDATVVWRLRLTGSHNTIRTGSAGNGLAEVPAFTTDAPWWLELLSTGYDADAGCALVRGVLHLPVRGQTGPPPWAISLVPVGDRSTTMPLDAMGVRPGR